MMHSPEHARAWIAPHNQPTLGRVVPAIGVSAPARGQPFKQKLAPLTQIFHKITASCSECGAPAVALFSDRLFIRQLSYFVPP